MGAGNEPSTLPSSVQTAWSGLRTLLGESHLTPALPRDRIEGVLPESIAEPGNAGELAAVLRFCGETGRCAIPRGSGSKMGWGNPPKRAHLIISTRRLNQVLEHAWGDMTATVEAGCVFADVQRTFANHGQRLALDPLWPEQSTIGGILATNDSGALRTRFGSLRDLIIGVTLALPDGTIAKSGGKVVKNVAGYDLAKLVTGSLGTLGIITQAIFRLHPIAVCTRSLSFNMRDHRSLTAALLAILDSHLTPSAIQIRVGSSAPPIVDTLWEGTSAGCDAQTQQVIRLLSSTSCNESDASVWKVRERLFEDLPNAAVCKLSLLPSELETFCDYMARQSQEAQFSWALVMQAVGVGLLRLEAGSVPQLRKAIVDLRQRLESNAGSLAILQCPQELKNGMDVWGDPGDALLLMKSIKAQFDPGAVLNPGRFVGSI